MNVVGPRVKELRESMGFTQEEMAARLTVLGWDISRGTYSKIEAQCRRVTDDELPILAVALKVEIKDLYPSRKR